MQPTQADHAAGVAEIGRLLVPHGRFAGIGLHAGAVVIQHPDLDHRGRVSRLCRPREQSRRLHSVLAGDLADEEDVAQAVHRFGVVLGGSRVQPAQPLHLVHCHAASLQQRDGKGRHGAQVACIRSLPVPLRGHDIVAGHAVAGGVEPAQSIHDVGIALIGQSAQRLQEIAVIGCNTPHFDDGFAAGHQRHDPLAKLVQIHNGPAVHADDDIAEPEPGLLGRTAGRGAEEQHALAVREAE